MKRPHISYAGFGSKVDQRYAKELKKLALSFEVPYEVKVVPGGHMSSIRGAVEDFLGIIQSHALLKNSLKKNEPGL